MNIDERLVNVWVQKEKPDFLPSETGSYVVAELERITKEFNSPICEGMLLIQKNFSNSAELAKTISFLNTIQLEGASVIQLFFFYTFWFRYAIRFYRKSEAMIMFNKLENLMELDIPKSLKAEYYYSQASLLPSQKVISKFKKFLSMLDVGTHQYKRSSISIPFKYAEQGKLEEFGKTVLEFPLDKFKNYNPYINAVVKGQLSIAKNFKKIIFNKKDRLEMMLESMIIHFYKLHDLYSGKIQADEHDIGFLSAKALLDKNVVLALDVARNYLKNKDLLTRSIFSNFAMVRAELSNKNINAASSIMNRWDDDMKDQYISDFFRARLELLKGCPDKAVEYFAKLLKSCQKYNAMGRLDFEIDLACELKLSQVRFLTEKAMKGSKNKNSFEAEPATVEHGVSLLKGSSLAIDNIKEEILKYANLNVPVLILGETGVGKDVIANALHEESDRNSHTFLAVNCSSIAENLLQSELFGYQAGAYTGASKSHKGIFQEAGRGTVFLDEIGDISPGLQSALLRVLESGEYRPVGSAKPRKIQCQIIAATNVLLESKVDQGLFRKDLLYRLKRLVIKVPPLRERAADISFLMRYFLNLNKVSDEEATFSDELKEALLNYSWPGNVRELKNEIEKMRMLNSDKQFYDIEDAEFLKEILNKISIANEVMPENKNDENKLPAKSMKNRNEYILEVLENNDTFFRRIATIKELFEEHHQLTRKEIGLITGCHLRTIGRDLKKLIEDGFIKKMEPTASPRTHYFILNK